MAASTSEDAGDELIEQVDQTNAYLARIASTLERTRSTSTVTAFATGFLAALVLLGLILGIAGQFAR